MYIHSLCSISTLPIIRLKTPLLELIPGEDLQVIEPVYNDYISPMQSRRMTKGLKMGLTAALDCIQQVDCATDKIQAIDVGTAYGLLRDSEAFLSNMIAYKETALNPTAFIQSTHNTVSGTIALSLKSHAHNMTFVQKGHSFEDALLDAELSLNNNSSDKFVLLGAVDERIDIFKILYGSQFGNLGIGEAASFFLLGNGKNNSIAEIVEYKTFKTNNQDEAAEHLKEVMSHYDCEKGECPTIIWNSIQPKTVNFACKIVDISKIVGFNPTGSALALAIGAKFCQEQQVPVVIFNQFMEHWSVFELK